MKTLFEDIKTYSLITIAASVVMGIILLIYPEHSIKYISLAVGGVMIALGIFSVIRYFTKNKSSFLLTLGVLAMVCGVLVCAKYKTIVSLIEVLFGVFLLCSGVVDLVASIDAAAKKSRSWLLTLVLSVVSIIFGIISIIRPFTVSAVLVRFIGVGLLIYAVMDIISYLQFRHLAAAVAQAQAAETEIIDNDARVVDTEED